MTDSDTDKRFSEASDLHRALESLCHVPAAERQLFFHDRLMSAIDDVCKSRANDRQPFTNDQINVLKEISFRIVYIMDPLNKPQRGFFNALRREFGDKSAMEKIAIAAATVTFIVAAISGAYTFSISTYEYYQKNFSAIAQPIGSQPPHRPQQIQPAPNLPIFTR